jgi:hypothetical protein
MVDGKAVNLPGDTLKIEKGRLTRFAFTLPARKLATLRIEMNN